uniref:Uncharacterized protein n=1 Tax=Gossypium raimondii TaxID=29730 RepID=A0A0D2V0Q5_GOSRA|nr:hypothetical protein B456_012G024400 [Gossypium raimondii]
MRRRNRARTRTRSQEHFFFKKGSTVSRRGDKSKGFFSGKVPPAHLNPKSSNHMDALAKTREAKIKRLQEIILEANLELARLKKKRRLE